MLGIKAISELINRTLLQAMAQSDASSVPGAIAAQAAPAGAQAPGTMESVVVPMVLIFAVFYFLLIRPQAKKQKEQQKFLGELKRGDQVITAAGILGKIEGLTEKFITLEIADGVRIKILRQQIVAGFNPNENVKA